MATLYDEEGTEIFGGRKKYSRNARSKIADHADYVRYDEEKPIVQTLYDRDR